MAEASRLYGMKAIVTGAASGIGEAIARTFVKHGAEVLAADEPGSGIDATFRRLSGVTALAIDPGAPTMAAKLTQAALDELGGVDILVNNYACDSAAPADPAAALERLLQQITETSDAALPLLKQSPAGRVINIGCLRSAFGPDGEAALAASEEGLAGLTARQAAEFGGHGITANYLQPGAIMTPQSRAVFDADKAFRDRCIRSSAAKRLGEPLDVAKVALFLASGDSVFVSGTRIAVDGGAMPEPAGD
ncbi:MAG TPA: SDR family oxidoreductase [Woeseiaceae bacterium]|nr:SDR family oxidoreductase [Woeseiaceae bacterium]